MNRILLKDITADWLGDFSKERGEPSWLAEIRLKAFSNYLALPWPSKRDEHWKRTNLDALPWEKLVLENSTSNLNDKSNPELPESIPLDQAIKSEHHELKSLWEAAVERAKSNAFESLALALGTDGAFIRIPKNKSINAPLYTFLSPGQPSMASFPLHFIVLEEGAEAPLWEDLNGRQNGHRTDALPHFMASYTSLHLGEKARAHYTYLQHWGMDTIHFQFQDVIQEAHSAFDAIAVQVGGLIFHNECNIDLAGQGSENKILGVLFGDRNQNFENWIFQHHRAIQTKSDIRFRGALKGSAKSFFSGLISITKNAQQSDAYQSAKHLLLSEDARADAIPNLEILADDVQCSHGAAVGTIDEDQKYYLQTRGLSPGEADKIIIEGFLEPVIAMVPSASVRDRLRTVAEEKINRS